MEKAIQTLDDLETEAAHFIGTLTQHTKEATLVTLTGELGAGKTAFVKAVARALGVDEVVNSPTFVLEKIYSLGGETPKFKRLIHIDAYRLHGGKELAPLGFDELMKDSGNLVMLEWPERVKGGLPAPAEQISFTMNPDGSRTLSYG